MSVKTGSSKQSPFIFKKIVCPVCEKTVENRDFRAKCYSEKEIDIDRHTIEFGWRDQSFCDFHPPLYHYWHCPVCKYTSEIAEFEDPVKNSGHTFSLVKKKYLKRCQDDRAFNSLIFLLAQGIDYDKMNYFHSLKLHLLTIYIQEIVESEKRNFLILARCYLRTGWLFRELAGQKGEDIKRIITLIKLLKSKFWNGAGFNDKEFLIESLKYFSEALLKEQSVKNASAAMDLQLWMAGINIKVNKLEQGLKHLDTILSEATKQKNVIDERLNTDVFPKAERMYYAEQSKGLASALSRAEVLFKETQGKLNNVHIAFTKKIMAKNPEMPVPELRKILLKKGIPVNIIDDLAPEKKAFFGLFG
jgi:uncharacterized protein (DUF2225 family)